MIKIQKLSFGWICLYLFLGLAGCSDDPPAEDLTRTGIPDLAGSHWRVEDIDAGGIIDSSNVTIAFVEPDRIAGSASCNRYFGTVSFNAETLLVSGLGTTRMACAPALNKQEQRFLAALREAASYEADDTFLRIFDGEGRQRIRAVKAPEAPAGGHGLPADAVDPARANARVFDCGDNLSVALEFVGPETIRLSLPGGVHTLQRERSASGARYVAEGIMFWNKGDQALLNVGDAEYSCAYP